MSACWCTASITRCRKSKRSHEAIAIDRNCSRWIAVRSGVSRRNMDLLPTEEERVVDLVLVVRMPGLQQLEAGPLDELDPVALRQLRRRRLEHHALLHREEAARAHRLCDARQGARLFIVAVVL